MISILILTRNEERNIRACIESVRWSDDIVVLDSFSSDRTIEIARALGARVVQRRFDDWATHQNWALRSIEFRHKWIYYSDADEIVPPALADELRAIATDPKTAQVAYRLRYKNYFAGRWIKHCGIYPVWVLRFFKPAHVRWERLVNPTPVVDGPEGRLREHFLHFSFRKGLRPWWRKHLQYAELEARETIASLARGGFDFRELLTRDPVRRRRALKELSFRAPCRPLLRFLYMYVWRLGFLDGRPGLAYCRLLARYEQAIVDRVKALRGASGRNPARSAPEHAAPDG